MVKCHFGSSLIPFPKWSHPPYENSFHIYFTLWIQFPFKILIISCCTSICIIPSYIHLTPLFLNPICPISQSSSFLLIPNNQVAFLVHFPLLNVNNNISKHSNWKCWLHAHVVGTFQCNYMQCTAALKAVNILLGISNNFRLTILTSNLSFEAWNCFCLFPRWRIEPTVLFLFFYLNISFKSAVINFFLKSRYFVKLNWQ